MTAIRAALQPIKSLACAHTWFNAMDPNDIVALYPLEPPRFDMQPTIENKTDVDNRIRFGLRNAIALNLLKPGSTVIAVQGWKGGLGHTNTLRVLSVPTDPADLQMQPLGLH